MTTGGAGDNGDNGEIAAHATGDMRGRTIFLLRYNLNSRKEIIRPLTLKSMKRIAGCYFRSVT